MVPWVWFWSPAFYFPFSGSVVQQIEPDTNWFFAGILAQAGNGAIEKKAFDVASYGRQLGWITEVLLADRQSEAVDPAKSGAALRKLEDAYRRIEHIKEQSRAELAEAAVQALARLQQGDPLVYEQLLAAAARALPTS